MGGIVRKYPRLSGHCYNGGDYFITVCVDKHRCLLGDIRSGEMIHSEIGSFLHENLTNISTHFDGIEIPLFAIMPNHFHAIIQIVGSRPVATANKESSTNNEPVATANNESPTTNEFTNLGKLNQLARLSVATGRDPTEITHHNSRLAVVVGSIKAAVTRFANERGLDFKWQPRYHDHIIRGQRDGNLISNYIINNVDRWADDCFYRSSDKSDKSDSLI